MTGDDWAALAETGFERADELLVRTDAVSDAALTQAVIACGQALLSISARLRREIVTVQVPISPHSTRDPS